MLKISGKNLAVKTEGVLRQCAALVTSLIHKYRSDIFFRTRVNVVSLQILFGVLILIIFGLILGSVQANLTEAVATGIGDILVSGSTEHSEAAIAQVEAIRAQEFFKLFFTAIAITGVFGIIISHVTLTPTRNAFNAQKRFIGNIAHELRTPLSIIKTNLEVMLLRVPKEHEMARSMTESIEELDRTSDIINNLVNFNGMVEQEQISFENVKLDAIIESVLRHSRHLVDNKRIHMAVEKSGEHRTVWGNVTAIEQVLTNLLRNAINYTTEGGRVTIRVQPDYRGYVLLSVADTGEGISKKDLLHVFEPFYRADEARVRGSSGSGLGLTIVNEIVKAHHGKISIKSAPKKGTVVTVALPSGTLPESGVAHIDHASPVGPQQNEITLDFSGPGRFLQ